MIYEYISQDNKEIREVSKYKSASLFIKNNKENNTSHTISVLNISIFASIFHCDINIQFETNESPRGY